MNTFHMFIVYSLTEIQALIVLLKVITLVYKIIMKKMLKYLINKVYIILVEFTNLFQGFVVIRVNEKQIFGK